MHQCDQAQDPRGGLRTLARTHRAILAIMGGQFPAVIAEVDDCAKCRMLLTVTLAGIAAGTYLASNPDSRMGIELQLSVVEAALERGEV